MKISNLKSRVSVATAGVFVLSTVLGLAVSLNATPAYAAATDVTAYIDLTIDGATNDPSTITTPAELATSTADEFYFSYVASSTEFLAASGETISIYVPAGFTSVATCATPTTDVDGDTSDDGDVSVSGSSAAGWTVTYTIDTGEAGTTLAATSGVEVCFAATTPATVGNYSFGMADTNDSDISAALVYVGDDNDVTVTAVVPVTMSLEIKEETTTTDTNACDLGILNPASVNTCAYRIKAGTNHADGMKVTIVADDYLDSGANDIDDVADGTAVTAGEEEYGAYVSAAGAFTAQGSYTGDSAEINSVGTDAESEEDILSVASTVDDSSTANWATVTHSASVNTATATGSYDQVVTYRAYAN